MFLVAAIGPDNDDPQAGNVMVSTHPGPEYTFNPAQARVLAYRLLYCADVASGDRHSQFTPEQPPEPPTKKPVPW